MGVFTFFKTRKPRQFNYKPIYWDKELEERQEKVKKNEPDPGKSIITKGFLREGYQKQDIQKRMNAIRKQYFRLFFILAVLFLLVLFLVVYGDGIFSLYFRNGL